MFERVLSRSERALFRYESMRGPSIGSEMALYRV